MVKPYKKKILTIYHHNMTMASSHPNPNPNPCIASAYHFIQRNNAEALALERGNSDPRHTRSHTKVWSRINQEAGQDSILFIRGNNQDPYIAKNQYYLTLRIQDPKLCKGNHKEPPHF